MDEAHSTPGLVRNATLAVAIVATSLVAVAVVSSYGALVVVLDGAAALAIMVPAILFGLAAVRVTPFGRAPLRWQVLLGCALGLGLLSLLALLVGLAGFLERTLSISILVGMFVVGLLGLRRPAQGAGVCVDRGDKQSQSSPCRFLWWIVVPFLALAMLAAAHPPGFLWAQEGFGYDVLEYHLQLPREYLQAGAITYLPHNVYGNFPAATEMLYMVAMIVHGKVQDAGTIANMIHLVFGLLTVFAAWVVGREWSRVAGTVAAVAVATVGWLVYLSGLAYVENAMLFFGMTATGAFICGSGLSREDADSQPGVFAWLMASGLCAGCACGCKYTGVVFVLVPLALGVALFGKARMAARLRWCGVFCIAAMVPLAPWLIKNQVWTGNPVFPLANSIFDGGPEGWGNRESVAWDRGHALKEADRSIGRRLSLAWSRTFADSAQRLGPVVLVVGLLGLLGRRRKRIDAALALILVAQVLIWIFATHLFARFAVVFLIPLSLLLARTACGVSTRRVRAIVAVVAAGAVWNAVFIIRLYATATTGPLPASLIYEGELPGYEYVGFVNNELPNDAKVLLLGEARAFYVARPVGYCVTFNRNPFLAQLLGNDGDENASRWFAGEGYTHLLVHYAELRRLSQTYGTSPPLSSKEYATMPETLRKAGFRLVREYARPGWSGSVPYVAIYELAG